MKRRAEAGFTIIELVVVIALLALLAAVALPRFVNLRGNAQAASFSGVKGAFASSVALMHAQWLAQNGGASITLDGGATVAMDANGWPDMTAGAQDTGTKLYGVLMQDGLPTGWSAVLNGGTGFWDFSDSATPPNVFHYDPATGRVS